jgi:hypothetical protein
MVFGVYWDVFGVKFEDGGGEREDEGIEERTLVETVV